MQYQAVETTHDQAVETTHHDGVQHFFPKVYTMIDGPPSVRGALVATGPRFSTFDGALGWCHGWVDGHRAAEWSEDSKVASNGA